MKRRRTDKPTEEELGLLTENHRLGASILQLERAAEIDAANLRNCFEDKDALRGSLEQLRRDYVTLENDRVSLFKFLNSWARYEDVAQAESAWDTLALASRLYTRFEAVVSENRSKCSELAEMAGEIRELKAGQGAHKLPRL